MAHPFSGISLPLNAGRVINPPLPANNPLMMPLMVSLSNHPGSVLRQAQDERRGQGGEFRGNRHSHPKQPSLSTTVVPAKAGIQEIPRKRAGRLPRILDSGFRRNDGFMVRLTWGFPVLSPFVGITIHVGAGL